MAPGLRKIIASTSLLPSKSIKVPANIQLYAIEFSDPNFYKTGTIEIILGTDIYEKIVGHERKQITGNLFARQTAFGWTVSGTALSKDTCNAQAFRASVDSVDFQLQQFWEIEELPQRSMWTRKEITVMNISIKIRE